MINRKIPHLFEVRDSLGPLESEVMKIIWSNDKTDVREVTEAIRKEKPIAYTTVMTVMDNLFKKGFLTRRKTGKAYQYKTVAPKSIFLKESLFLVTSDLIAKYGRARIILTTLRVDISLAIQLRASAALIPKISRYKKPAGWSAAFTFLSIFLFYSVWDLFQNLKFFGTVDYVSLALSEPSLIFNRYNLFTLAVVESLPMLNLSATIVFFILFILVGKRLNKILDRNIFPRLGGLA